jgi:hypothetical protein
MYVVYKFLLFENTRLPYSSSSPYGGGALCYIQLLPDRGFEPHPGNKVKMSSYT